MVSSYKYIFTLVVKISYGLRISMKTSNFDVLKLSRDTLKNLHHPNLVLSGLWSHLYRYLANGHSVGGYGFDMVLAGVFEASIYTGLNHVGAFVIHKEDTVKIQDWPFGAWQKVWRFGLWKLFLWYYLYGFENYPYMRVCLAQKVDMGFYGFDMQ